ncbi:MAG TPA: Gfo/Idh/MocA family oxidoreductase [Verrucomicrobiae bacterium]|nr:Gfo/Idh/MocA family oxidoreductase [Verrucomicrobiae bacterium]
MQTLVEPARLLKRFVSLGLAMTLGGLALGAEIRIGIIGCDTSHVTAFTELLNNPNAKGHVPGGKVVAAFKGGSPDLPKSISRVEGFAKTLQEKYGVTFYDSIAALCTNVDAVLLESVDGRVHLEQAKPVIKAGKPLFVDKPMAASLRDVMELFRLAKEAKVPVWSSSSLRFASETQAVRGGSIGRVSYAETHSPCEVETHHPELMWYGVHGVESLFTVMGTGCESVQRGTTTNGLIEVVGTWRGGRKGVYREDKKYHGLARGESENASVGANDGYAPLLAEIMKFFQTGVAPVTEAETLEIFAFMEAADESKRAGGTVVRISDVMARAKSPTAR